MKRLSNYKWSILVLVVYIVATLYFMAGMPSDAKIPSHWNARNEIDGWMSKTGHLSFGLGLSIALFLMMYFLPYYSPWYKNYNKRFETVIPPLTLILMLFFSLINLYALYLAKTGIANPKIQLIMILIGLMFILLGNLMPKLPKNFFIGIKTPWTLSNDEVWQKTHRVGAYFFVLSGIIMIIKGFVASNHRAFHDVSTVIAMGILLFPLVYSFFIYKKING